MRTTVDLPTELLRAAKAEAAARGETLKEFLACAITHELGNAAPSAEHKRVRLPLIGSAKPGAVDTTNVGIEAAFAAEDAEKYVG